MIFNMAGKKALSDIGLHKSISSSTYGQTYGFSVCILHTPGVYAIRAQALVNYTTNDTSAYVSRGIKNLTYSLIGDNWYKITTSGSSGPWWIFLFDQQGGSASGRQDFLTNFDVVGPWSNSGEAPTFSTDFSYYSQADSFIT